jgi:hypothetical protein
MIIIQLTWQGIGQSVFELVGIVIGVSELLDVHSELTQPLWKRFFNLN